MLKFSDDKPKITLEQVDGLGAQVRHNLGHHGDEHSVYQAW